MEEDEVDLDELIEAANRADVALREASVLVWPLSAWGVEFLERVQEWTKSELTT